MASFTLVVEDSSPLISYAPDGAWVDTIDDPLVASYSGGSFHKTTAQDATVTFSFNGTGVRFFGGRRPDYGNYTLTVDNQVVETGTARSETPSMRNLLAAALNLPDAAHVAVLTTSGGGAIDLDWVEVAPHIGTPGSKISASVIDDTDSRITYLPSDDAWTVSSGPEFTEESAHFSNNADASATVKFTGEAIGVYGTVSADHSDIRVNIDGQDRKTAGRNRLADGLHAQTLVYFEDSLGPGEHTMVVSAIPRDDGGPPLIDIDSMSVFASAEDGAISAGSVSGSSGPSKALIGGIVGGVIGLLLIVVLILLLIRRTRQGLLGLFKKRRETNLPPLTPALPMQAAQPTPGMMEAGVLSPKPAMSFAEFSGQRGSVRQSLSPGYFTDVSLSPTLSRVPSFASSTDSTAILVGKGGGEETLVPPPSQEKEIGAQIPGGPTRPKQRPPTLDFKFALR